MKVNSNLLILAEQADPCKLFAKHSPDFSLHSSLLLVLV